MMTSEYLANNARPVNSATGRSSASSSTSLLALMGHVLLATTRRTGALRPLLVFALIVTCWQAPVLATAAHISTVTAAATVEPGRQPVGIPLSSFCIYY